MHGLKGLGAFGFLRCSLVIFLFCLLAYTHSCAKFDSGVLACTLSPLMLRTSEVARQNMRAIVMRNGGMMEKMN